jgi:hypothetical protein
MTTALGSIAEDIAHKAAASAFQGLVRLACTPKTAKVAFKVLEGKY